MKSQYQPELGRIPIAELIELAASIPPGVFARHGTRPAYPSKIPDLIGVRERRYLDATGLAQPRSIEDLMRYAITNQTTDRIANFNGFQPWPTEEWLKVTGGRYSDEQLYAGIARSEGDREENLHTVLENGFGHRIVVAVRQGSGEGVLHQAAAHFLHGDDGGFLGRRRQHRTCAALQLPRALGGDDDEAVRALLRIIGQGAVSVIARRFVFSHTSLP